MNSSLADEPGSRQRTDVSRGESRRETEVSFEDLRGWIQVAVMESRHTLDSLAASMGFNRSYIGNVLSDEKPMTLAFVFKLPADVHARVSAAHAEHFGHIVVTPAHGSEAMRFLVAGLVGVLTQAALPAKAGKPLRAAWDGRERRTA